MEHFFKTTVFGLLTKDIYSRQMDCSTHKYCINVRDEKKQYDTYAKTLDEADVYTDPSGAKEKCLVLPLMQGHLNCSYLVDDGLKHDLKDVLDFLKTGKRKLEAYVSKKEASWDIDYQMLPEPEDANVKSFQKVVYTLWVRLMKTLTEYRQASTAWIKPGPMPFFQDIRNKWKGNFSDFDITERLTFDATVKRVGQSCGNGKPTIDYYECSGNYNSLYFSSAKSYEKFVRKRGAPIIQPGRALLWPGLSLSHHISKTVPAWSMSGRYFAFVSNICFKYFVNLDCLT